MTMRCFLDMDGVLTDFQRHMCEAHGRPWEEISQAWPPGCYRTHEVLGITEEEMWGPARGVDFWEQMPKTDECDDVLALAASTFGRENVAILTRPSKDPLCATGKLLWFHRHFPEWTDSLMIGSKKHLIASPNAVLFDDWDSNVRDWCLAGGVGVLVPRLWNSLHAERHQTDRVLIQAFMQLRRQM